MVASVVASVVALVVATVVAAAWDPVPEGPDSPQGQFPSPTFPCWHWGGSGEAAPSLVVGEHPQQVISWVLISSLHRVRWVLAEGLEARSSGGLMSPRSLPSQLITPGRGDGGAVHLAPPRCTAPGVVPGCRRSGAG